MTVSPMHRLMRWLTGIPPRSFTAVFEDCVEINGGRISVTGSDHIFRECIFRGVTIRATPDVYRVFVRCYFQDCDITGAPDAAFDDCVHRTAEIETADFLA